MDAGSFVGPFARLRLNAQAGERHSYREFRRAEEDEARKRIKGQSPCLSRRCGDRVRRERRRWDHHLQLRWSAKHQTTHRQGGIRRQQFHARGSFDDFRRRIHSGGIRHHKGRGIGRAGHWPGPADREARLGQETPPADQEILDGRHWVRQTRTSVHFGNVELRGPRRPPRRPNPDFNCHIAFGKVFVFHCDTCRHLHSRFVHFRFRIDDKTPVFRSASDQRSGHCDLLIV